MARRSRGSAHRLPLAVEWLPPKPRPAAPCRQRSPPPSPRRSPLSRSAESCTELRSRREAEGLLKFGERRNHRMPIVCLRNRVRGNEGLEEPHLLNEIAHFARRGFAIAGARLHRVGVIDQDLSVLPGGLLVGLREESGPIDLVPESSRRGSDRAGGRRDVLDVLVRQTLWLGLSQQQHRQI